RRFAPARRPAARPRARVLRRFDPAGNRHEALRAPRHCEGPHPPGPPQTPRLTRAPAMIDERHEELAALHALDLLEGAEREAFARELDRNAELRALVAELRESSAALAHTAPAAAPPAELRARVLASITHSKIENRKSKIVTFPSFLPWAAAACFALLAAWL